MLNEETVRKLIEMRMSAMAESYSEQISNASYQDMTFEERFNLLVDHEYSSRKSNSLQRLLKQAQFSELLVAIEDIEYHPNRHLDKNLILELATGNYIQKISILFLWERLEMAKHGYQTPSVFKLVANNIKLSM